MQNVTRAIVNEGDVVFDMSVTALDDELFRDEEMPEGNAQPVRLSQANESVAGTTDSVPSVRPELVDSTNNNTTRAEEIDGMVSSRQEDIYVSARLMKDMARNENFMEDFAQYMLKKGYIQKQQQPTRMEIDEENGREANNRRDREEQQPKEISRHKRANQRVNECNHHGDQGRPWGERQGQVVGLDSGSEVTIYKRALQLSESGNNKELNEELAELNRKRDSSSSEELINLSDESNNDISNPLDVIAGKRQRYDEDQGVTNRLQQRDGEAEDLQPHCSRQNPPEPGGSAARYHPQVQLPHMTEAERLVQQAERNKARILEVPGRAKIDNITPENFLSKMSGEFMHSMLVDEEFSMVASHITESLKRKIINCEYVDFVKLLPREDFNMEMDEDDADQYVMINEGGHTFWTPERELATGRRGSDQAAITFLHKWEQAFRIFSHVYTAAHPSRATELTQYSFIIHAAAQSFPWENAYAYDVIFRRHMSKFPTRSWGIILQEAWSLQMRTKNFSHSSASSSNGSFVKDQKKRDPRRDLCWKFNLGRCTYGVGCKFKHRCSLCLKFGHGSNSCRRASGGRGGTPLGHRRDGGNNEKFTDRTDRYHFVRKDLREGPAAKRENFHKDKK